MVEVGGTGVRVSLVEVVQQYTQQYVLNGSTSFSEYQQVGGAGCGCRLSSMCVCGQKLYVHLAIRRILFIRRLQSSLYMASFI